MLHEWMLQDRMEKSLEVLEANSIPATCTNCAFYGVHITLTRRTVHCFLTGTQTFTTAMQPICKIENFTAYMMEYI